MMKAATKSMRIVPLVNGMSNHVISFAITVMLLYGCTTTTIYHMGRRVTAPVQLGRALNIVLSWPSPTQFDALKGAVLLRDGAPVAQPELAVTRAILHTNPRIVAADALLLAVATTRAARTQGLPPEFLGATLLQESAYDVEALSAAGAIGIAQFIPETAAGLGVNPYDPLDSIAGAAWLLGAYVTEYRDRYADPYAAALAAYNAGPLAVQRYRGVPPYAETHEYIALIFDRWAQIVSYEHLGGVSSLAWKRFRR
jgi:soluble lytic murein transglycosylase-like protein